MHGHMNVKNWKTELDIIRCPIKMTEINEAMFSLTHPIINYIKKYTAEDIFRLLSHIHHILHTRVLNTNMPPK